MVRRAEIFSDNFYETKFVRYIARNNFLFGYYMTAQNNTASIIVSDVPQEDEESVAAESKANAGFSTNSPHNNWLHFLASLSDEERERILKEERAEERKRMAETYPAGYLDQIFRHRHLLHSLRDYARQVTVPRMPDGLVRSEQSIWVNRIYRRRNDALREISRTLARGEPIRGSDIQSLCPEDIEKLCIEGDPYLRKIVLDYERAQARQQALELARKSRGRDFGR
jgi:hypothetical protein